MKAKFVIKSEILRRKSLGPGSEGEIVRETRESKEGIERKVEEKRKREGKFYEEELTIFWKCPAERDEGIYDTIKVRE